MKALGLKYFTDTNLTSLGLIIFFVFFIGMLIHTMSRQSQKKYEYLSQLPLEGEHNVQS